MQPIQSYNGFTGDIVAFTTLNTNDDAEMDNIIEVIKEMPKLLRHLQLVELIFN